MDWILISWGGWREWMVPLIEFSFVPASLLIWRLFRSVE